MAWLKWLTLPGMLAHACNLALRQQTQEDQKFKARLGYTVSLCHKNTKELLDRWLCRSVSSLYVNMRILVCSQHPHKNAAVYQASGTLALSRGRKGQPQSATASHSSQLAALNSVKDPASRDKAERDEGHPASPGTHEQRGLVLKT